MRMQKKIQTTKTKQKTPTNIFPEQTLLCIFSARSLAETCSNTLKNQYKQHHPTEVTSFLPNSSLPKNTGGGTFSQGVKTTGQTGLPLYFALFSFASPFTGLLSPLYFLFPFQAPWWVTQSLRTWSHQDWCGRGLWSIYVVLSPKEHRQYRSYKLH